MGVYGNTCHNCGEQDVKTFYCRHYNWDLCGTCYTSVTARIKAVSYPTIVRT